MERIGLDPSQEHGRNWGHSSFAGPGGDGTGDPGWPPARGAVRCPLSTPHCQRGTPGDSVRDVRQRGLGDGRLQRYNVVSQQDTDPLIGHANV